MQKTLQERLRDTYKHQEVKRDAWGRREPTSREVEQAIDPTFPDSLDQYAPREEDLEEKEGEG